MPREERGTEMFFNILKKDLKRKKSINAILLTFIALSAAFIASSVNNLSAILNAVEYFGNQSVLADYTFAADSGASAEIDAWLASSPLVSDYQKEVGLSATNENFKDGAYEVIILYYQNIHIKLLSPYRSVFRLCALIS